jgi:hypothetical protein
VTGHAFTRPGQVAPDRPAPDRCMQCGLSEAQHVIGGLGLDVSILARELSAWSRRDSDRADAGVRQSANVAVSAIDRMLADLHRLRGQLVTEVRRFDDATMARVDAMLAEGRARREAGR